MIGAIVQRVSDILRNYLIFAVIDASIEVQAVVSPRGVAVWQYMRACGIHQSS